MAGDDQMPPTDVVPCSCFEPDAAVDDERQKSQPLVQRDAARIGQRDARVRVDEPLRGENRKERCVKSARNTPVLEIRMHVYGRFHTPLIRRTDPVPRRVRVSGHDPATITDEPWILLHRLRETMLDVGG